MKNWEYEVAPVVVLSGFGDTLKEKMIEFGKKGWEIFNIHQTKSEDGKDSYILFMKREKESMDLYKRWFG